LEFSQAKEVKKNLFENCMRTENLKCMQSTRGKMFQMYFEYQE